ncbi:unnamed protein product [Tenebrio molitor]|nr:unnamed protein product [Tenebrio molitor]
MQISDQTNRTEMGRMIRELYTKTYFYIFSYDGALGHGNVHYDGAESVGHSEDTYYLFCSGEDCDASGYPEQDQVTRDRLLMIWTDFAKYQ